MRSTPPPIQPARIAYSLEEAAQAMGLSSQHVRRLVLAGELGALRSGRRVLITPRAIDDYLGGLALSAAR